jgi:protocatechuate 3,4-dioxygenase beta subunit
MTSQAAPSDLPGCRRSLGHMDTTPRPHDADADDHDRGLQFDMSRLLGRRRLLGVVVGAAGTTALAACGFAAARGGGSGAAATTTTSSGSTSSGTLTETPEETAGPYPGDGSNGANVLTQSGIVRSDIRSSFGTSTTTAPGVPLTIRLTVRDTTGAALVGYAVYLWHCDRDGRYSLYTAPNENYLRGVQETGGDGAVTFTSIFPACYDGRWPHIHYELYPSLASATSADNKIGTSQIALPEEVCDAVYAVSGYEQSVSNMSRVSLATDNVFSDGWTRQLATVTGDVAGGYTATVTYVL